MTSNFTVSRHSFPAKIELFSSGDPFVSDTCKGLTESFHRSYNTESALPEYYLSIVDDDIPIPLIEKEFLYSSPEVGAVTTFTGIPRCTSSDTARCDITHLLYECYTKMVLRQTLDLCNTLVERYDGVYRVAVVMRVGLVPLRSPSLFVGVASSHRQGGREALHYAVEEIKHTAAVWKKELTL